MELRTGVGKINRFEQLYMITTSILVNLSGYLNYIFYIFPSFDAVDTINGKIGKIH